MPDYNILDKIGGTPLVEIRRLNPNPRVRVLAKLESMNPGGSVKDRVARAMIEAGEASGELNKSKTIIEATSGNTGIGLAMVSAVKGYRLLLIMSEAVSMERRQILTALGAEIMLTPGHLGTDGAIEEAYRLAREEPEKYFLPDQFNNPANVDAHYQGTGREVWEQTEGQVTHFVASMGTTGTIMGVSKRLKEMNPAVRVIGAEPYLGHKIQGLKNLKEAYVPGIFEKKAIDELIYIDDEDAFEMTRRLAREEGLFLGMSSGAAMHVALEKAKGLESGLVVVLLPDGGERYLSTPLFVPKKKISLAFYNVLSRAKEPFQPVAAGKVGMYTCGPALYSEKHVAAFRQMVMADLVKRYLMFRGFEVRQVMNLVDIDDRTIAAAKGGKKELTAFAELHFKEFLEDCARLNILPADEYPRASEHVDDMVDLANKLTDKGYAYEKLRSLYFGISRLGDYGRLSGVDLSKIKLGKTVDLDVYEKDNPRDFTLFKRSTLAELKRGLYYQTQWGAVRPGWHIECAAISTKHLGCPFDLHTGGAEMNFPHHENVQAICQAAYGKPLANYWLHSELVLTQGQKMSRSAGNAPTIKALLKQGHEGRVIRYWLMSTHYRKPLVFSASRLAAAARTVGRLDEFIARVRYAEPGRGMGETDQLLYDLRQAFIAALDDDLNVAHALAALFRFIREINPALDGKRLSAQELEQVVELFKGLNEVLGIMDFSTDELNPEEAALLEARDKARREKDWAGSDRLRDELAARGVKVIDTPKGTRWQRL